MADDDLLGAADDAAEDAEEEASEGGGSPLMKYLPIIAIVLVVQIVMVDLVATWWLAPSDAPDEPDVQEVAQAETEAPVAGAMPPGQVSVIYEKLDPIVVNPAGTEGLRFLSATVHLGLSSQDVLNAIDANNLSSKIRDRLIDILRAKTIDQLDPAHHEEIKREIRRRLNEFLGENAVLEVYFQGFVLQ
jgi:flagellar basal body-associated protein FliL